jgi:hypothetical protein
LVDAAFGPVLRYFDVFEEIGDFGFFDGLPRLPGGELGWRNDPRSATPWARTTTIACVRFWWPSVGSVAAHERGGPVYGVSLR